MKLLFENWREWLKRGDEPEEANEPEVRTDPRIQRQLDALLALPGIGISVRAAGAGGGSQVKFEYTQINDVAAWPPADRAQTIGQGTVREFEAQGKAIPWGSVAMLKASPGYDGKCLDGYIVYISDASHGWGPLLYEVALEWASQKGGGLSSDRSSVSKHAEAVWGIYATDRPSVDKKQMDISHISTPDPPFRPRVEDIPQLTPDDESDDCNQQKALEDSGSEEWMHSPFSKMYYKGIPEIINALTKAKRWVEE
tara:strand:- start:693 stop:1454 length:762 start_codon:yes stop_codon:yes gene_type:complete